VNIKIVCAGRALASHEQAWVDEYILRAKKYARVEIVRIKEQIKDTTEQTQNSTWKKFEEHLDSSAFTVLLAPEGKNTTTEELKKVFDRAEAQNKGKLSFLIGGSYGFPQDAKRSVSATVSFGSLTLPHRLVFLILCEQIYRVLSWKAGSPYHHA
jgi:23S rRNA (pseudouridine1915-N3)-methyltransferase